MDVDKILNMVVAEISKCTGIIGIVLGGSRATGMYTPNSDIDVGVYYDKSEVDFDALNLVAQKLDDRHSQCLICQEGQWGEWVNCGGWLIMDNRHVDIIMRDIARVRDIIKRTDEGSFSINYQTGHPHAYIDAMYRGELALSKTLFARDEEFLCLKDKAQVYPKPLREALISFFMFEAEFSCSLAESYAKNDDIYYTVGHLFRAVSAINQVVFAANEIYCLNEKKAVFRIQSLPIKPKKYREKVESILSLSCEKADSCIGQLKDLCSEVKELLRG